MRAVTRLTVLLLMAGLAVLLAACGGGDTLRRGQYIANLGLAQQVSLTIDIPLANTTLDVITSNGINAFEGTLTYIGDVAFEFSGTTERVVSLVGDTQGRIPEGGNLPIWDLKVSRNVPVDLSLTNRGGNLRGNLSRFNLSALEITHAGGSANFLLPEDNDYIFRSLNVTDGDIIVIVGRNRFFETTVNVSGGALTLNVLETAPVQINVLNLTERAELTVPEEYLMIESEGGVTWQSEAFDEESTPDNAVILNLNVTGGAVTVQFLP